MDIFYLFLSGFLNNSSWCQKGKYLCLLFVHREEGNNMFFYKIWLVLWYWGWIPVHKGSLDAYPGYPVIHSSCAYSRTFSRIPCIPCIHTHTSTSIPSRRIHYIPYSIPYDQLIHLWRQLSTFPTFVHCHRSHLYITTYCLQSGAMSHVCILHPFIRKFLMINLDFCSLSNC